MMPETKKLNEVETLYTKVRIDTIDIIREKLVIYKKGIGSKPSNIILKNGQMGGKLIEKRLIRKVFEY